EVARRPRQEEEIPPGWEWTDRNVWTPRMLNALEKGVNGGKWYSLIDKVSSVKVLNRAFVKGRRRNSAAGVDHQTFESFETNLEGNIEKLSKLLKEGRYEPQPVKRIFIPKPGSKDKRPLGIPTIRDRIVQRALQMVLEPIFENEFAECSYGFRPGRGCKDALRQVEKSLDSDQMWVVDGDIKGFFDTIDHEILMERINERIIDSGIHKLLRKYLKQNVMENASYWTPEGGMPQGAVISPLLSNIYLNPLDHLMMESGYNFIRYADDWVVLCKSETEAKSALETVKEWVIQNKLELHPEKTRIVNAENEWFEFLGYKFVKIQDKRTKIPSDKAMKKLKETLRSHTKRTNGHSLEYIVKHLNNTLKGWFEYFKHSHKWTFPKIDIFIRKRLRSILRRRKGGKGYAKGKDNVRWPNKFFTEIGLYSVTEARLSAVQSLRG
ncbi:MAG: group II intron reverse transcriptase/maturase, partial [Candidatus Riflebacteria bacterium]